MKNTNNIKGALLQATIFTAFLLMVSCTNNQKQQDNNQKQQDNNQRQQDSKTVAEDRNEEKFDNRKQEKDAQFIVNAAENNLEEILLGKLAQQKGTAVHVKELGKMMEQAHTKSHKDLIVLANSKRISIPNSPTDDARDAYNNLNKKSGNDFDKAYAELMVDKHEDAIEAYEKATTDGNDSDIKNYAIAALPNLRTHLNHSVECQKKCDKV